MPTELVVASAVHVIAAVFWAGTTFALAHTRGEAAERFFTAQMRAAIIAILAGAYLWRLTHAGSFGRAERALMLGALCALLALAVQAVMVGRVVLSSGRGRVREVAHERLATPYQISAGLLVITILSMASARFL